jgi:hypothetical protein
MGEDERGRCDDPLTPPHISHTACRQAYESVSGQLIFAHRPVGEGTDQAARPSLRPARTLSRALKVGAHTDLLPLTQCVEQPVQSRESRVPEFGMQLAFDCPSCLSSSRKGSHQTPSVLGSGKPR